MSIRSVNLTTLFLGKLRRTRLTMLSPVTDNCPIWISGRGRMAVEIISWPIATKELDQRIIPATIPIPGRGTSDRASRPDSIIVAVPGLVLSLLIPSDGSITKSGQVMTVRRHFNRYGENFNHIACQHTCTWENLSFKWNKILINPSSVSASIKFYFHSNYTVIHFITKCQRNTFYI